MESPSNPAVDLNALTPRWAAAFNRGDLNGLVNLYDKDALLWGISSSGVRKGTSAIRDYYAKLFKAFPGTRISLEESNLRVYGEAAVSSGVYAMRRTSGEGGDGVTSARFTVVYAKRDGKWMIVDHHSSLAMR